jgi:hypothetical protein
MKKIKFEEVGVGDTFYLENELRYIVQYEKISNSKSVEILTNDIVTMMAESLILVD